MGQILVRNLDDEVISGLRRKADFAGKSMEQFLRDVLAAAAPLTPDEKVAASRRLCGAFAPEDMDMRSAIRWGRDDETTGGP